jgi:hypothetical protein
LAHSSATASVMRSPLWYCGTCPRSRSCSLICGRQPLTITMWMPIE